jgi:hypothetical protein
MQGRQEVTNTVTPVLSLVIALIDVLTPFP